MALRACICGGKPRCRSVQVAEDAVDTWVECGSCNRKTDYIEDAYSDRATAEWQWNRGDAFR